MRFAHNTSYLFLFAIFVLAAGSSDSLQCILCSDAAGFFLTNPNATGDITAIVDLLCELLPDPTKAECEKIVATVAGLIQKLDDALRLQEELDGRAICTMIYYCTIDCCISDGPEQVHLSFLEDPHSTVGVTWVTRQNLPSLVRYGTDKGSLSLLAEGTQKTYTKNAWLGWIHNVKLSNLTSGTRYYYQVGSDTSNPSSWSTIFSFVTEADDSNKQMFRFAEIGDMGADPESLNNTALLKQLVQTNAVNFIIHDGDISYADGYQHRWDLYLRQMEPVMANIQYMTTPGNHEVGVIGALNLSIGYIERFMLPGAHAISSDLSNMYYSWNYGNTHFVALDTESVVDTAEFTSEQVAWLVNDLSMVDRSRYPWIILFGHRPFYCSNSDSHQNLDSDCGEFATYLRDQIEDAFNKYKVDVIFTAHKHNYERLWPVKPGGTPVHTYNNPGAPVYIINGAGGNREGTVNRHQPNNNWSVQFLAQWGYMIISVYNDTVMDLDFYAADNNQLVDHVTLTVDH